MRLLLLLLLSLFALPASAAVKVMNLDDIPHTIIVNNGGERSEILLSPNQSYVTYGPMVDINVKGKKRVIRAHVFGEYAIWGDGRLVLQMIREPRNSR